MFIAKTVQFPFSHHVYTQYSEFKHLNSQRKFIFLHLTVFQYINSCFLILVNEINNMYQSKDASTSHISLGVSPLEPNILPMIANQSTLRLICQLLIDRFKQ